MNYAAPSIRIPALGNPHEQVRLLLQQMKVAALAGNSAKADDCSIMLETLTAAYMDPNVQAFGEFDRLQLTNSERRVVEFLKSRPGSVYNRSAIMNALYFDHPDGDWPEQKIVDVFICKLRKKLQSKNATFDILTIWGRGYQYAEHAQRPA